MTAAHEIVLASAGTGKTWRLVQRVLGLLLQGAPLSSLVATTFTRKAAGQILDRILDRLAEAVGDEQARRQVAEHAGLAELGRERCLELLAALLGSIHAARVSTLDAWFAEAVWLRAWELGLPPGARLADEDEDAVLRGAAMSDLVAELPVGERGGLLADLRGRGREGSRGVHQGLLDLARDGLDLLRAAAEGAFHAWAPPPPPDAATVHRAIAALGTVPLPRNQGDDEVPKDWSGALAALVAGVSDVLAGRPAPAGLLGKGLAVKILRGEPKFGRHAITPALVAALRPLIDLLAAQVLADLAARTAARHALLTAFERHYAVAKQRARRLRFDDLPRLLTADDADGAEGQGLTDRRLHLRGLPSVQHLLLDEFQDTSLPQWLALRPLVESLAADRSGARTLFCVGDVKQSIYGWRGGEPRLLAGLGGWLGVAPETLTGNWRSAPVVLETVGAVLSGVAAWPALADEPALLAAAQRWDGAWPAHRAARDSLPGHVSLWQAGAPAATLGERRAAAIQRAATLAAEAARALPDGTVGILVRSNKPIPRLLHALRELGVPASGEGGNLLTDAEAVRLALSALHLADHPRDGLARLHLACSAFGAALGLVTHDDEALAARCAARIRDELSAEGYAALLSRWQREVVEPAPVFGPWDQRRFAQLVELAGRFDERGELRASAFVAFVRRTPVEDASASRVQVMTIHKAKGLEFHAVVLPDLDGELRVKETAVLVGHADPRGRPECVVTGARQELLALDPRLRDLADATWGRAFEESLCVLYVALTRAMRRLDVVLLAPAQRTPKLSLGALVRARLAPTSSPDADGLLWRAPDSSDAWGRGVTAGGEPAPDAAPPMLSLPRASVPRLLAVRAPSTLEGGAVRAGRELLAPRAAGALARGTALHLLLEQVEWLDDPRLGDDALSGILAARGVDEAQARDAVAGFRAALARPAIAALLRAPSDGATREVWRERRFVVRLADGDGPFLLHGSFDRLVVTHRDGHPVAAQVIDWKSDVPADEAALAARVEHHRPQLQAYRRAAAALLGLQPAAVDVALAFVTLGRVVPITS